MPYLRPFVTNRFTAYAGDSRTRRLTLAVRLVDERTDEAPVGSFRVFLVERRGEAKRGQEPIVNGSGYYCFLDVPAGDYTIRVEPAPNSRVYDLRPALGGVWSDAIERVVTLPMGNPLEPVVELRLAPTVAFPFSPDATLVRGRVRRGANPAPGAVVRTTYRRSAPTTLNPNATTPVTIESRTGPRGYYALFFRAPSPARQNLQIVATAHGQQHNEPALLREGEVTKNVDITVP